MIISFSLATGFSQNATSAFATAAIFAPTSMGIALIVLRREGELHTHLGALVVAAAVCDDIIALVVLSELEAMREPSALALLLPIVSSVLFTTVVGCVAVFLMPWLLSLFIHVRACRLFVHFL